MTRPALLHSTSFFFHICGFQNKTVYINTVFNFVSYILTIYFVINNFVILLKEGDRSLVNHRVLLTMSQIASLFKIKASDHDTV